MDFRSDNVTGVAPEILAAIVAANEGPSTPYGNDEFTRQIDPMLSEIFEHPVRTFPVATGTAANGLGLSAICPPFGAIYCHPGAHIILDECGAPEMYTGGAKLVPVDGRNGKIDAAELGRRLARECTDDVHRVQPAVIGISQTTEAGTVYGPDEIAAFGEIARRYKLRLHMDGTRFANAVAATGAHPKDLTWKAGVDVLSLGATKNGALAAELVVFFDPSLADQIPFRRKRAGHLLSKGRFISAQLLAYFQGGLWLKLANHANEMAARIAAGFGRAGVSMTYPTQANEVFASLSAELCDKLQGAGFDFYRVGGADPVTIRIVAAFNTRPEDADRLVSTVDRLKNP